MKNYILLFIIVLFNACSSKYDLEQRNDNLKKLSFDMKEENIESNGFKIRTYSKINNNKNVKIFIEGDGLAWIDRNTISNNPTPLNPTALSLSKKFDNDNIIYIARPCQYNFDKKCDNKYWTNEKFSKEMIFTIDNVITYYKNKYNLKNMELYGFSGGGTIATIISSERDDVKILNTIAGNLDTEFFEKYHNVSKSKQNLNPVNFCNHINIPQYHYVGKNDDIIPIDIFKSYDFKCTGNINLILLNNKSHTKDWEF